jgi:L-aspartate oxidase
MSFHTDFLVIGTGIAGLSFALRAAEHGSVAVVTKRRKDDTNTNRAQGGIAAALGDLDTPELHRVDTITAGANLNDRAAVELVTDEGPAIVQQLVDWGVNFTKDPEGTMALGREGGHSLHRIVHARDLTGAEIERALITAVERHPNISLFENHVAIDLITEHHLPGAKPSDQVTCWGAYVIDTKAERVIRFQAHATMLSTGGAGQIWRHTTNPEIATGDGIAMAYRAGARVANLEFMQFHPTMLYDPDNSPWLISEAVRGYGGRLFDMSGNRIMEGIHDLLELAPRDIVARAIDHVLKRTGNPHVLLDVTHMDPAQTRERFPAIHRTCLGRGIDITTDPIPVVPAAHYMCGGVVTNLNGQTDIKNLYACGEVAQTGLHGANRLASNSLLEAVVFANRSIESTLSDRALRDPMPEVPDWDDSDTFDVEEWILMCHDTDEIRDLMWDYVGIVRSDMRLRRANHRLELIWSEVEEFYRRTHVTEDLIELRNMVSVAALVVRCAMERKESRGLHYTTDFPEQNDEEYLRDTVLLAQRRKESSQTQARVAGKLPDHHEIPGPSRSVNGK